MLGKSEHLLDEAVLPSLVEHKLISSKQTGKSPQKDGLKI